MKYSLTILLAYLVTAQVEAASPNRNHGNCRPIRGYITADFTAENCASPVGICTQGKIWGDPIFQGTTRYTAEKVVGSPIDPTMETSLSYAGTLVIHTRLGEVTITDLGLMDRASTLVSSQSRSMSGDGKLAGLFGAFFTTGRTTSTGFSSEISGRACFAHETMTP